MYRHVLFLYSEWRKRSSIVFSWEMSRRGTHNKRGPRKFLIFGERRKCGKPNSRASFFLQATSDEVLQWCRRLCLTCSTHWALRMIWLCSITLADKSAKDKPPSVVGVSRLTLLDCLTTWVYLDNTRTRMRVLFYMVICASFYLDYRLSFQSPLTPFAWGRNSCVRSLRSRG